MNDNQILLCRKIFVDLYDECLTQHFALYK